jgi:hypothetical protein
MDFDFGLGMYNEFFNNIFVFLMVFYVVYSLSVGAISAWLASLKGYSPGAWFFLGFLFNMFAIMAVGFAPNKYQTQAGETDQNDVPSAPVYNAMSDAQLRELVKRSEEKS